jgi:hypothetical protein
MPINIIYAYPLYLGGYDIAAMLGGNADQQIVLCNDLARSTAYLVTGSRIDREVAEMLLECRAVGGGARGRSQESQKEVAAQASGRYGRTSRRRGAPGQAHQLE